MNTRNRILIPVWAGLGITLCGCDNLVLENVVAGLRDGAVTATTGIVEGFFNTRFELEAAAAPEEGNDEHVRP